MNKYELEQQIETKKAHVCGSRVWIVKRLGADIKLQCAKCGREIYISKVELDKKRLK